MKLIKGLGLLSFLTILSVSCFDPPEFPVVPQIEFERLEFVRGTDGWDTLNLYIKFKDGNGDLGLSDRFEELSDPYHPNIFYQENNGQLEPLSTSAGWTVARNPNEVDEYELLHIPDPSKGKLVTYRTRKKPEYNFLPPALQCTSGGLKYYEYLASAIDPSIPGSGNDGRRLLIEAADKPAMGPSVQFVDSFPTINPQYYQIRDTLYYTPNPNHNNIEVDWLVKGPTGFTEYDWYENFCTTFDGRFPYFSDTENSVDGSLRYSMYSLGFRTIFSISTLKLRVSIKDRALNVSNVIETPEFTLH